MPTEQQIAKLRKALKPAKPTETPTQTAQEAARAVSKPRKGGK